MTDVSNLVQEPTIWTAYQFAQFFELWRDLRDSKSLSSSVVGLSGTMNSDRYLTKLCEIWRDAMVPVIGIEEALANVSWSDLMPDSGSVLGFMTSGTSGDKPKVIWKTHRQLESEAFTLIKVFGICSQSEVVSLVPPAHIYGFLYAILAPALAGANTQTRARWSEVVTDHSVPRWRIDFLVTVPPLWNLVSQWVQRASPKCIWSSGAAFGMERSEQALALRQLNCDFELFDIVGSTETGGIGYRNVTSVESIPGSFTLFDEVDLEQTADKIWRVRSSFTGSMFVAVSDQFESTSSERQYRYLGRSDRIVKVGARRVDLADIEHALQKCGVTSEVCCLFMEDASLPKGGRLIAFAEPFDMPATLVLARYNQRFLELPPLSEIRTIESFPRGAAGKIARATLRELSLQH